jgi:D-aminopeptidase
MSRARFRDLGYKIGSLATGRYNAITDVPGVLVGHVSLVFDQPRVARTGITVVVPRDGAIGHDYAFAGFHRFNGCGEMTGIQWLEESGLLTSAIAITNTHQVGLVRDALSEFSIANQFYGPFFLPVVTETYDGWLSDSNAQFLTKEHLYAAMQAAQSGPVAEGGVGGGTGMICHGFKGGIGTASRVVETSANAYTLGALVQTNYGDREQLRVAGVPVGLEIGADKVPTPWDIPPDSSSIVVVLATDAPLLPDQCKRLAQRATAGLARAGGVGLNTSGDLFLAFATGQHIPARPEGLIPMAPILPQRCMDAFFTAAADAVEESILNALCAAETMSGYQGHIAYALPLDELQRVMARYQPTGGRN